MAFWALVVALGCCFETAGLQAEPRWIDLTLGSVHIKNLGLGPVCMLSQCYAPSLPRRSTCSAVMESGPKQAYNMSCDCWALIPEGPSRQSNWTLGWYLHMHTYADVYICFHIQTYSYTWYVYVCVYIYIEICIHTLCLGSPLSLSSRSRPGFLQPDPTWRSRIPMKLAPELRLGNYVEVL